MARQNFERVMEVIFRHEGGYVNHPRDPGGATNMGITKRTLENHLGRAVSIEEVKALSKTTAREIYRKSYWNVIKGDDLPAGLDLVAMDGAVNSGPSRGAKWLQRALGVTPDGVIGPVTIEAAHSADKSAIDRAIAAREVFLRSLPTWKTFGKGWSRRLKETRDEALRMFETGEAVPGAVSPQPTGGGFFAALAALFKAIFGGRK